VSRTCPTRGAGSRRDHAADRRFLGPVHGPLLTALGERRPQVADAHPGLDDGEHLGRVVRDELVEHRRPQLRVDLARLALGQVGAAPDDQHAGAVRARGSERVGDVVLRVRV
jgi:hypothetical protein